MRTSAPGAPGQGCASARELGTAPRAFYQTMETSAQRIVDGFNGVADGEVEVIVEFVAATTTAPVAIR